MRRRDREPLEEKRFIHYFFEEGSYEPTVAYGDMERGFIFGFYRGEIFIPTHFAPKIVIKDGEDGKSGLGLLRGGYSILKELSERKDLAVATAVTDDLAKTLMKMKGWHRMRINFLAFFNQELEKKVLVYNSAIGIRKKLVALVREFWEETKRMKEY
jgi:hypothetical protein